MSGLLLSFVYYALFPKQAVCHLLINLFIMENLFEPEQKQNVFLHFQHLCLICITLLVAAM